jgi:hypothetical protein
MWGYIMVTPQWIVRMYMLLFGIILGSLLILMLFSEFSHYQNPNIDAAVGKLTGLLELVIGAVVGALTSAAAHLFPTNNRPNKPTKT